MKYQTSTKVLMVLAIIAVLATAVYGQEIRGKATQMPAYYDAKIFQILFWELPPMAETSILQHNGQFNFIYQSDQAEAAGFHFISVIDAIPADGMNPLWNEVQIVFAVGVAPRQFFSDDEILAAAATNPPEILLIHTQEVYNCGVIGKKPSPPPAKGPKGATIR